MAGKDNLIPLTTEKAREIGKLGAIASIEARREKSKLKRIIAAYLDTRDASGLDNETKIVTALGDKALKGDVVAAGFIADRLYDKPKQSVDQNVVLSQSDQLLKELQEAQERLKNESTSTITA